MRHSHADWLERVLPGLRVVKGPDARGEYLCWCEFHADGQGDPPHNPNMKVGPRGWFCHVCDRGGGLKELAEKLGVIMEAKSERRFVAAYQYRDERGTVLYESVRWDPKDFQLRRPNGNGGFTYSLNGTRRVLYRLQELTVRRDETVWFVEGEKDADRLASLGLVATTNAMGARSWREEYADSLRDRHVVIIPDNDAPGEAHAQKVAQSISGIAASVRVLRLAGLPQKGDVSDWLDSGHTVDELQRLAAEVAEFDPSKTTPPTPPKEPKTQSRSTRPQADQILDLAHAAGCELLHDHQGSAFARIRAGDHWEVWPVGSSAARSWLTRLFHEANDRAPNLTALNTAANALQAQARFAGEPIELHNRVAWREDSIYYDLGDAKWRAVRISAQGWEVIDDPPPLFRRYGHQLPQVLPQHGGSLDHLFEILPITDLEMQILLRAYLVTTLIPSISHPVLILHGPQGSSKTVSSRVIRRLTDPSVAEAMAVPEKPDQLIQMLAHNWMPVFDNVSTLPRWISETLCRTATGEAFSKRTLYTDDDDFIWAFRRCSILNGINVASAQPDLLDRAILVGLEPIPQHRRRSEEDVWEQFNALRPSLFGAILDTLSAAMSERPHIIPCSLPRMADFAHWGMAVSEQSGASLGAFLNAYETNIARQNAEVINAHPLASALMGFARVKGTWSGQASDLLCELNKLAPTLQIDTKDKFWPRQPNVLVRRLNELTVNLRAAGVHAKPHRDKRGSQIDIAAVPVPGDDGDDSKSISSPISSPPNQLPSREMEGR